MSEHSPIGWTDATWPIVAGCEYESPGCSNCWAVRDSWRLAHNPHKAVREAFAGTVRKTEAGALVWTGVVRPLPERLDWPLRWRAPRRIFVCSQADLFHPKVPDEFIDQVFAVMAITPRHTFQVLTKRAERMSAYMISRSRSEQQWERAARTLGWTLEWEGRRLAPFPLPNVWLGISVEDQVRADERVPHLLRAPAAKRWLSVEPMLEPIRLTVLTLQRLDWIVCGGESAQTRANTRYFDVDWARDLRDKCRSAGTAFFMKQGGSRPTDGGVPIALPAGKSSRYKFHELQHLPGDLQIQEFPDA